MDHMGMDMGGGDVCPMSMTFHWRVEECVLFSGWHIKTAGEFWLSGLAIIGFCIIRELLLYVSKRHELKALRDNTSKRSEDNQHMLTEGLPKSIFRLPYSFRVVDALLYGCSVAMGYWLMLIVMTYNAGLCFFVLFGFIFARLVFHTQTKREQRQLEELSLAEEERDHCHVHT